jgi:hypothetical protein
MVPRSFFAMGPIGLGVEIASLTVDLAKTILKATSGKYNINNNDI